MDTAVKLTPERFKQGLTLQEFVADMSKNRDVFEQNYNNFTLKPEDVSYFADTPVSRVLVLAEDWCGDVLRYLPVLARLAGEVPAWTVRVFCRDQNLDLADNWKKHGEFRAIPVMVFFDRNWRELACFIERPLAANTSESAAREAFAAEHPNLPGASAPYSQMEPETAQQYSTFMREFRARNSANWQQMFLDELKKMVLKRET